MLKTAVEQPILAEKQGRKEKHRSLTITDALAKAETMEP